MRDSHSERGSILPFVALAMVMAGASVMLLGRLGVAATARASARTAADAAALAGAAEGRGAALSLAQANGAELLSSRNGDSTPWSACGWARPRPRVGPSAAATARGVAAPAPAGRRAWRRP